VIPLRPAGWDWSFAEEGALALAPEMLWEEPSGGRRKLNPAASSATVPPMATARHRDVSRVRSRQRRRERHTGRLVLVVVTAATLVLVLLLSAFGSGSPASAPTTPAAASRLLPTERPQPQVVATMGALRIQLPVAQSAVTAIGFHRSGNGGLQLAPIGRQGNAGVLTRLWHKLAGSRGGGLVWYQLGAPGTSGLDIGAAPGTDVYAPVDGTVVGITDYVVANRVYGKRIDIRPQTAPSVVVSLTQLKPDDAITVGSAVAGGTVRIGTVIDLAGVERQSLARYTQDAGNNVSLEVRTAATLQVR
jgi:hypothetical protein